MREIIILINDLSAVPDLKFVGGTSLFLQEKISIINDIDVLVEDVDEIGKLYPVTIIEEPLYKFPDRRRGYFVHNGILVDVFIQQNNEETILVGTQARCCTINAQIQFLEKTLSLILTNEKKQETVAQINYLRSIRS